MPKTFWRVKLPRVAMLTHAASSPCVHPSQGALREPILVAASPGFPHARKLRAWLWHKAKGIWIKLVLIL